jgi:hypothetical protein
MEPSRTGGAERDKREKRVAERAPDRRAVSHDAERDDELDGQLGPDELPDPAEVAMNLEAKRHH